MFEFFRKHNKIMMVLLFLLIIPSFVLFGIERYTREGGTSVVAKVDGGEITRAEWDARHRNEVDQLRRQSPDIDPMLLDSEAARYATLESMVRERVLAAAAGKGHMGVSEERLARLFAEDAGLAAFRGPDGKFDRERFIQVTGQTPEQYEAAVRAQLSTQQVLLGIAGTAFAPPALADVTLHAFYDRREIQLARFEPAAYAAKVSVSDADIEAYYKDHAAQFQAPEQADVEYIVLDLDSVRKGIALNEADLKTYYEQNRDRFGTKEERRASHILITAPASAPSAEREKAKARTQELLAEVRKSPGSFAELAKKNSQDPGSAEKGGDLDFVTRGAMVKPFEDAMFGLKKGEISDVVETEFGYHVIKLDDIKPGVVPPFEQVRVQIENEVRSQQAAQEYAKAAEAFTDLVYQQPDSLQPAADKFKLTVRKASEVTRTPAPGATGPLGSRNFLSALFAPDSLQRKHNTEAVDLGASQLVAGRVTRYAAARTLPLAEVKDKVKTQLVNERAAALAKADGAAKLAAWQADPAAARLGTPLVVSRQEPQSLPPALLDGALRVDTGKLPALAGVDLGAQGYAVVRVDKVVPRTPPPEAAAQQERAQFAQAVAAAESAAYYALLKDRFKAQILVPRPTAVAARG